MAASVQHLLESLETHLERTKAELQTLREENARLKQQLAARQGHAENAEECSAAITMPVATEQTPKPEDELQSAPVGTPPAAFAEESSEKRTDEKSAPPEQPPSPQALLKQWYQRYPDAFFKGHTKPLKIGIHQDLAEREPWSGKLIRRALANYVNLPRYVKSMREGAERVDLDGKPAGTVDKEAALHASERRKEQPQNDVPLAAKKNAHKKPRPAQTNTAKSSHRPYTEVVDPGPSEKSEQDKPLSWEEKLKGLQQKFKGR